MLDVKLGGSVETLGQADGSGLRTGNGAGNVAIRNSSCLACTAPGFDPWHHKNQRKQKLWKTEYGQLFQSRYQGVKECEQLLQKEFGSFHVLVFSTHALVHCAEPVKLGTKFSTFSNRQVAYFYFLLRRQVSNPGSHSWQVIAATLSYITIPWLTNANHI